MSKGTNIIILGSLLIIFAGAVAFFYWQDSVFRACEEFQGVKYEEYRNYQTSCKKATETALKDSPGKLKSVQLGTFTFKPRLAALLNETERQMWLIDIELQNPVAISQEKTVNTLRVGVPLDGSPSIFHTPID